MKFPKTLYAKWHNDGRTPADAFLRTDEQPTEVLDKDERARVAVYELKEVVIVENSTTVAKAAKRK